MRNLIRENVATEEIRAILDEAGPRPLLPPMEDACWRDVAGYFPVDRWIGEIRERAIGHRDEPLPELSDQLYADFSRTGRRLPFERIYFERRRRLGDIAVAALFETIPENERIWISALVEKIEGLMAEESWALPAHVNVSSGKDSLQIDLFAAETANLMAELVTVFGDALPKDLVRRIFDRLHKETFENYLQRRMEFGWPFQAHNWNAVCHQGVIGAALSIEVDTGMVAEMLRLGAESLRRFLEGFADDGGCSEGPSYWNYGFGWFSILNEQIETRTGGRLTLIEGDEKIRRIARFPSHVSLEGGYVVNFADSVPVVRFRPSFLQYLGERLDDDLLRDEARYRYSELASKPFLEGANREDLFHHLRLFLYCPDNVSARSVYPERDDVYFPDLEVMVIRAHEPDGSRVEFAAKGGNNAEHHNHNDCGSYLYHVDGRRFAIEIGSPEYDRGYFGPRRYEYLAARSRGHSLPLINGFEQGAGEGVRAEVLAVEFAGEKAVFELDLTRCFPVGSGCRRCVRRFLFDRRSGALRVEDRFSLMRQDSLETALITDARVRGEGDRILLEQNGVRVELAASDGTVFQGAERCEWKNHEGEPAAVTRLVFRPAILKEETILAYTLTATGG